MKIKITRETHGHKAGKTITVTAALAGAMMAGNFAVEEGKNELSASTLSRLNGRQLKGLAKCRGIEGYLHMQPGQLIAAIVNAQPAKKAVKKAVAKTAKKKAKKKAR